MALTYPKTQANPQQNPTYQRRMNPPGRDPLFGPQAVAASDKRESSFYDTLRRRYGTGSQGRSSASLPARPAPAARTQQATSPVTSTGQIQPSPPQAAPPQPTSALAPPPPQQQQPQPQSPQQATPVDPRTYRPPDAGQDFDSAQFFAGLSPGMPVAGSPGRVWTHTGQGWAHMPAAGTASGTPPAGNTSPADPFSAPIPHATTPEDAIYGGYDFDTSPVEGYQPGHIAADFGPVYTPDAVTRFVAPNTTAVQGGLDSLMQRILANPESMSPEVVAALKEQQKEGALTIRQQLADRFNQGAVSRGLSLTSGQLGANQRRLASDTAADITRSYRDIDIAAATQNAADRRAAVGLGSDYLTGAVDRAGSIFRHTLAGEQADAANQQAASELGIRRGTAEADVASRNLDEAFRAWQSGLAGREFRLAAQQAQAGDLRTRAASRSAAFDADRGHTLDVDRLRLARYEGDANRLLDNRRVDVQERLGTGAIDVDRARLGETARQFDRGYNLDFLRFLEGRRQFNAGHGLDRDRLGLDRERLGFDWAGLNTQRESDFLRYLTQLYN